MFTQQKVRTPPPQHAAPACEGTSVDSPPSPPPPPAKQKPQVPRKPQTKRVSFTSETYDAYETTQSTNDPPTPRIIPHGVHDEIAEEPPNTNDACPDHSSLLIQSRPTNIELREPKPSLVRPEDFIIPPPPLFAAKVSQSHLIHEKARELDDPVITVIPERVVLPLPIVAETTVQSSNSTNSPETEYPPPVNYQAHPTVESTFKLDSDPFRTVIFSEVPTSQVFRDELPNDNDELYKELSVNPVGEPDPPELLHAHYKTLPTVSHIPNSPCYLHPDRSTFENTHVSLLDLRSSSLASNMVHSTTYPPSDPYPSLTTVAGTFNPYTCTLPVRVSNDMSHSAPIPPLSPSLVTSVGKDINANVTQSVQIKVGDATKNAQSERRVRFGEVTTAPEFDSFSNDSAPTGESASPAASKPAWSSKIKSFAIGEVIITVRHLTHTTHGLL